MQFELTEALVDDIIFSMEDQEGEYYLDTVNGVVVGGVDDFDRDEKDGEGGERYIDLPGWDSSDGFRLMERFAAGFKNPLVREELTAALNHGRGVFRAYKNTLGRHPETEKLWFSFKEREMKLEVWRWYNGLREEWGLEKIGREPEETNDLVLEDFRFHQFREEDLPKAIALHRFCQEDVKKFLAEAGAKETSDILLKESESFYNRLNNLFRENPSLPLVKAMIAETGGEEFAGFISGIVDGSILFIQNLDVKPEYRGLGIGEALLEKFLDELDPNEITQVLLDLPSSADGFSRVLLRESFKPYTVRYWLNLRERAD